ncbi:phage tail protein [Pseudoalteromonas lipolytica]|uniref:phage tail-collar fiber domain-containing protein n=1 Tax=Pseudoalteromonas lipolytica TaxID=570156 RepID=UPI00082572D7|nr:phage tail protein [Pseudoalteromonas lipolytica]
MASIITIAGEKLFAAKAQANEQLDIDTFIFANVPGQDATAPINREEGLPNDYIVHQQIVQQVGRINDNVVVYSTVLDSVTGPFEFNWVGLYSSINDTLVAINHIPTTPKTVTADGVAGNTLNRNFGIEYSGIADLTGIDVAPETWQLDFTARLQGMDKLTQQLASDMNGKDWFIGDGFKVEPRETVNTFRILPGVGYVSGLRVELENEHIFNVESYPKFVYVDAWFEGNANSEWSPSLAFTLSDTEIDDYTDDSGVKHYVNKLAELTAFHTVEDLRPEQIQASKEFVNKVTADVTDGILAGKTWPNEPDRSAKIGDLIEDEVEFLRVAGTLYPIAGVALGEITELNLTIKPYHCVIGAEKYWLLNQRWFDRFEIDVRAFWPIGDNIADDSEPWAKALDYCTENKITIRGDGQYYITKPLIAGCAMNLQRCTLNYKEGFIGTAFTVGLDGNDERNTNNTFKLPKVKVKKTNLGWVASNIGVYCKNLYTSDIHIPEVENFLHGVRVEGVNTGNVYNRYYLGRIVNNFINLELWQGPGTGWCNENNFFGGRLAFYSKEVNHGTGTKQIYLRKENDSLNSNNGPNNNRFYGISVEGNVQSLTIDVDAKCPYNIFQGLRYEGSGHKVRLNGDRNCFFYGYGLSNVEFFGNGLRNDVFNDMYRDFSGSDSESCVRVRNLYSDNSSALSIYNIANERTIDLVSNKGVGVKRGIKEYHEMVIDSSGIRSGDGDANPDYMLRKWSNYIRFQKPLKIESGVSFFDKDPVIEKPVIVGNRNGNEALSNLISALSDLGLIDNQST